MSNLRFPRPAFAKQRPNSLKALLVVLAALPSTSTLSVSVLAKELYQRRGDGSIWAYKGTSWYQMDDNVASRAVVTDGGALFKLHNDGSIWELISDCGPGILLKCRWRKLDNNRATKAITARMLRDQQGYYTGAELYQLHNDGSIWVYTGPPCTSSSCPGWSLVDDNRATTNIVAAVTADINSTLGTPRLYKLHNDGSIWRFGPVSLDNPFPQWTALDNNPRSIAIATWRYDLYQLHDDGSVWKYTGEPCSGASCPGWARLSNTPATIAIAAAGDQLYQLQSNGRVWQYAAPRWKLLDNNPRTTRIDAVGSHLYQLRNDGSVWQYAGAPCSGASCPGWRILDHSPLIRDIFVSTP